MEIADLMGLGLGAFAFVCWALFILVMLALFVFWIITVVDCAKRKNEEFPEGGDNIKTIWLVVLLVSWVVSLNWVAAIIYYVMVMRKKPLSKKEQKEIAS